MSRVVSLHVPGLGYALGPPYDPPNPVYAAVERTLEALGLDAGRRGTSAWSPLSDLVAPGGRVVLKPNLVSSKHLHQAITGDRLEASSTHGSLLRPLLDYALRAVGPAGSVRVVDAPVEGCELEKVTGPLGIDRVLEALRARGHDVGFVDLRTFRVRPRFLLDDVRALGRSFNLGALIREALAGDPAGYVVTDLRGASWFARSGAPAGERLRFHRSHYRTPVPHHTGGRHEYSLPRTVLGADLIVNVPKLKTHKKTGVTLSLKSVIGLTNEKYWLPHFTEGSPETGGDEHDRPQRSAERLKTWLSRVPLPRDHSLVVRAPRLAAAPSVLDGSWEGNDTLWRTILDLNHLLLRADRDGRLGDAPARRYLTLVDGIVAGEGEGPLGATPVEAGLLVAGTNAAQVDEVACRLIGFDPDRIPLAVHARLEPALADVGPSEHVHVGPPYTRRFAPPKSWPRLRA